MCIEEEYLCPDCGSPDWEYHDSKEGYITRVKCLNVACKRKTYSPKNSNSKEGYYKVKAIQLWLEGLGSTSISRILGVPKSTVSFWLDKYTLGLNEIKLSKSNLDTVYLKDDQELYELSDFFREPRGVIVNKNRPQESIIWGVQRKKSLPDS